MKLGSFFSLDGFDNGRRTGATGLVTYTAPGLLAVLFGTGHWLWVPGLLLGAIFGLSLKRRCRDAVRPRGYLVAALAPLPLWLLSLTFGWNLAFALVCFALGLAVTLLMAVLPSRPVKDYDEGYWHPSMPAREPIQPRREPVLADGEPEWDGELALEDEFDEPDVARRVADDGDTASHAQQPDSERLSDHNKTQSADPDDAFASDLHSSEHHRPEHHRSEHHSVNQGMRRAAEPDTQDDDDPLIYGQSRGQAMTANREPLNLSAVAVQGLGGHQTSARAEWDQDESGLVAPRRRDAGAPPRDETGSLSALLAPLGRLWPFGRKTHEDDLDDRQDPQRDEPVWQQFSDDDADATVTAAPAVRERTWSDAFNGEGSLEVLMEAIYFHLKRWWRFYLSGAAAMLVMAGGSWLTLRLSQAPETVTDVAVSETPDVPISTVTLDSGISLRLEGDALILGWSGLITDANVLWSLTTGEGDKYCATALFNNGNRYRPLTVTAAKGQREARFSPLDTQAIVRDLALRGNVQLCGEAFGLKGSQAVIESNARFAALLTP